MTLTKEQQWQEGKYDFPYHYLATWKTMVGIHYLSYLSMAKDLLVKNHAQKVLDAGCGDGRFISYVKSDVPAMQIEGTDYSEAALAFARIYNPSITFTCADLLKLPHPDQSFDALTLIEVIEHFEPAVVPEILRSCKRVLKPGGLLIITTPSTNEKKVSDAHYQHFTEDLLRRLLTDAGLSVVSVDGHWRVSLVQKFLQGLMQNRLFEIRSPQIISLYRHLFRTYWAKTSPARARRLVAMAKA